MVKVAIHDRDNSFSTRWIEYCNKTNILYEIVNCYSNDIISYLIQNNFTHLMWHFTHESYVDAITFRNVLNTADQMGINTFPSFSTRWHFDDKVSQKYLFDSLECGIESFVFYDKQEALHFIKHTSLPIVAKLKKGAGASNVQLIRNLDEGSSYIDKMFSEGIHAIGAASENFKDKYRAARQIKNPISLAKKVFRYLKRIKKQRKLGEVEKGYVYFQKFISGNDFDTRIIVIGDKAFGLRRYNRPGDFRASGSGNIDYDIDNIDLEMLKISFSISEKFKFECMAYDFLTTSKGEMKIVEISYGFNVIAYDKCPGYWDKSMTFHKSRFNPQHWMIENLIKDFEA